MCVKLNRIKYIWSGKHKCTLRGKITKQPTKFSKKCRHYDNRCTVQIRNNVLIFSSSFTCKQMLDLICNTIFQIPEALCSISKNANTIPKAFFLLRLFIRAKRRSYIFNYFFMYSTRQYWKGWSILWKSTQLLHYHGLIRQQHSSK